MSRRRVSGHAGPASSCRARRGMLSAVAVGALSILCLMLSSPADAIAQTVSVSELVRNPSEFDGETVTIEGEAIGETLRGDGGNVWVNVLDGDTAIGVYASRRQVEPIESFGSYGENGDRIRVSGEFHVGCDRHFGETDIHASRLEVVQRGGPRERPLQWWKLAVGGVALVVALIEVWLYRRQGEHPI